MEEGSINLKIEVLAPYQIQSLTSQSENWVVLISLTILGPTFFKKGMHFIANFAPGVWQLHFLRVRCNVPTPHASIFCNFLKSGCARLHGVIHLLRHEKRATFDVW